MIESTNKLLPPALALFGALALAGCPSPEPSDAGPTERDSGAPPGVDAGETDSDSGPGPECEPGEMRTASCGFCGTESQRCEDPGTWMSTSACLGEGECELGSVESRTGALCVEEQRICLDGCTWGDWEPVGAPGECEAGESRYGTDPSCASDQQYRETCDDTCQWPASGGVCVGFCDWAPERTTPEWAREVCVPGGDVVRGDRFVDDEFRRQVTVHVSSFYADVYPVTYRRYEACVSAGVCRAPEVPMGRILPADQDYPLQGVSQSEAAAFCAWDGGRRLLTVTEWMKLARGPAPRTNTYPWDPIPCHLLMTEACGDSVPGAGSNRAMDPYDAFPAQLASFYGAQMMGFGVYEFSSDFVCSDFQTSANGLSPDPDCTPSDPEAETRRTWLVSGFRGYLPELSRPRRQSVSGSRLVGIGFRCGHSRPATPAP